MVIDLIRSKHSKWHIAHTWALCQDAADIIRNTYKTTSVFVDDSESERTNQLYIHDGGNPVYVGDDVCKFCTNNLLIRMRANK